jgi:hypothetical protein
VLHPASCLQQCSPAAFGPVILHHWAGVVSHCSCPVVLAKPYIPLAPHATRLLDASQLLVCTFCSTSRQVDHSCNRRQTIDAHVRLHQGLRGYVKQLSLKRNCTFRQPWPAAAPTAWRRHSAANQPHCTSRRSPCCLHRPSGCSGTQLPCSGSAQLSSAAVTGGALAPPWLQPALQQCIRWRRWRPQALASRIWAVSLLRWDLPSLRCLQLAPGAT